MSDSKKNARALFTHSAAHFLIALCANYAYLKLYPSLTKLGVNTSRCSLDSAYCLLKNFVELRYVLYDKLVMGKLHFLVFR